MKDHYIYYLLRHDTVVSPALTAEQSVELMDPDYHSVLCVPADDKQPVWRPN